MKRSLLALAALTTITGVAFAQSSVTIFGVVDLSVNSVKNGTLSQKLMSNNQLNSNRLGFRGVEDLGGGMRAGFWLEAPMSNDDGNPGGLTFVRRSTVSLMGGFGELRMGRDYTPSFWNYTVFDPFGTNGPGSVFNIVSSLGSGATTSVRANNSVGYLLPAMGGVYGQAMVAAGEGTTGNKYFGGRIGYAGGPVNVAAAYGKTDATGTMADDFADLNVGASFRMGGATLMGQYSKRDYLTRDQKTMMVGATFAVGKSGTLKASYAISKGAQGTSATDFDAKQIAFGYQHDLSKRTALYGTVSSLDNDGTAGAGARFTVGQGPAMTAGGATSRAVSAGIRHSF